MTITEIRKMTTEQLTKESSKLRDELADMRRKVRTGEQQNVRAIRHKRKDLARIMTVLSEQLVKETRHG
jgi:large subunit ribosomal protein L29